MEVLGAAAIIWTVSESPPPQDDRQEEATLLLQRLGSGDEAASEQLLPIVYEQLRRIAGSYFRNQRADHTLQPTALVHEAYLKLVRASNQDWKGQAHFCAVAATAMRQILQNHAAAKRAAKRGGPDAERVPLEQVTTPTGRRQIDVVALDDALPRLAEADERQARIVELWFLGGLKAEEVAEVLGVSQRTVERGWRQARAWLNAELTDAVD